MGKEQDEERGSKKEDSSHRRPPAKAPTTRTVADLERPDALMVAFIDAGLTPTFLAAQLKAELGARITKVFATGEGIQESRRLPDWGTRQKARQDAHKLRGDYPPERREVSGQGGAPVSVIVRKFTGEGGGE